MANSICSTLEKYLMNLNSSPKVEPEVIRAAVYGKITPRRMHYVVSARFAASTFFASAAAFAPPPDECGVTSDAAAATASVL